MGESFVGDRKGRGCAAPATHLRRTAEASQRAEGRSLSLGPAPNPIRLAELAKHLAGARAWLGRRSPVHAISRGM